MVSGAVRCVVNKAMAWLAEIPESSLKDTVLGQAVFSYMSVLLFRARLLPMPFQNNIVLCIMAVQGQQVCMYNNSVHTKDAHWRRS